MNVKSLLHKLLRKLGFYGTLDTNRALREKNIEINRLKKELEARQGFTVVHMDPTVHSYPQQPKPEPAKMGAYDKPSPITDPLKAPKYVEQIRTQMIQHMNHPPFTDMVHGDTDPLASEITSVRIPTWIS